MISKKKGGVVCAVISLLVGTAIYTMVLDPVIDSVTENIPCPSDGQSRGACLNIKLVLYSIPYVSTFVGVFVFLRKIGVIE